MHYLKQHKFCSCLSNEYIKLQLKTRCVSFVNSKNKIRGWNYYDKNVAKIICKNETKFCAAEANYLI